MTRRPHLYFNPRSPHGERLLQVGKRMMEFDFNPRSPHGERRHVTTPLLPVARISIHAPRTGSDGNGEGNTLNARISIHAPRTGSDQQFQCGLTRCIRFQSTLPARGAWIEIAIKLPCASISPASLPVRGAWIEITGFISNDTSSTPSLPVRGAWIEIFGRRRAVAPGKGRSPCGERGLK